MATSSSTDTVIENQIAEYDDDLELHLKQIGRLIDIPSIINGSQEKPHIINYFEDTKFLYRFWHSWEGYLHFGISYDGKHKRENFKEQARIVERYIRDSDAKNVLELGCGMGTNTAFLARRNPNVTFDGVDLSHKPLKRYAKIPNAHFQLGDYHDLSALEDDTYDIAFVVEALCYSTNKLQVLREVKKKLKKDGLFIVIDGYQKDRAAPLSPSESLMWKLIEIAWSLDKFECVTDVESYMREEYSIAEARDITQCVLPSALTASSKSRPYFAHPAFARAVNKLIYPVKGIIAPHLVPISLRRQVGCYYIHVLKNDK
jgi:sterol 24-C-methyltransferase